MSFKSEYPHIHQWSLHGGTFEINALGEKIKISIGDAGGIPEDGVIECSNLDEGLIKADRFLQDCIEGSKILMEELVTGITKITDQEYLRVAGLPPKRNPYYDKNT